MRKIIGIILSLAFLALVVGGAYLVVRQTGFFGSKAAPKFSKNSYQAVFLSNGQVYFGKVSNLDSDYVKLNDIYYMILRRQPQEQTPPAEGETAAQPTTERTLIKLGDELHGPVDEMVINRRHILFVEELKDDSRVVKAIRDHKAQQQEQKQGQ